MHASLTRLAVRPVLRHARWLAVDTDHMEKWMDMRRKLLREPDLPLENNPTGPSGSGAAGSAGGHGRGHSHGAGGHGNGGGAGGSGGGAPGSWGPLGIKPEDIDPGARPLRS